MAPPIQIDRDALHRILWRRCDNRGRLRLVQRELALALQISESHFSRVIGEMREAGRLRLVKRTRHSEPIYEVVDPEVWAEQRARV